MRTDVKVGLVCLFVLIVGCVTFLAFSSGKKKTPADTPSNPTPALTLDDPRDRTVGTGLLIAPPGAMTSTAPATAPTTMGAVAIAPIGSGGRPLTIGNSTTAPFIAGGIRNPGPSSLIIEVPTTMPSGTQPALGGGNTPGTTTEYVVKKGDNFTTIARANHITIKALQAANPTVSSEKLQIGTKLKIPAATTDSTAVRPAPSGTSSGLSPAPAPRSGLAGTTYTVKKGDTLQKIAATAYGDEKKWSVILRANRSQIADANTITVGQSLKIPAQ